VIVVDTLAEVIEWHRNGLVPLGRGIAEDPRCRLVNGDFFERARSSDVGFDDTQPGRRFDAILLDIDHSPKSLLHFSHGSFYSNEGLGKIVEHLHPGGTFALWADGRPDESFLDVLESVFPSAQSHVVSFFNPLLECDSCSTVYVAKTAVR
jgi:spermidine synthase